MATAIDKYQPLPILTKPELVKVTLKQPDNIILVLFALETTSLDIDADISQIAVLPVSNPTNIWTCYTLPRESVQAKATEKNGKKIESLPYEEGIKSFYQYLCQLAEQTSKEYSNTIILLVGHEAISFSARVLLNAFISVGIDVKTLENIIGFADSFLLLHELRRIGDPILSGEKGEPLTLSNLHYALLGEYYPGYNKDHYSGNNDKDCYIVYDEDCFIVEDNHTTMHKPLIKDAVNDVKTLYNILFKSRLKMNEEHFLSHSCTVTSLTEIIEFDKGNAKCKRSFEGSLAPSNISDVVVLFDLETTGLLEDDPDICQIAAWAMEEPEVWSKYLIPQKNINDGASRINKLKVEKDRQGKDILTKYGIPVKAEQYEAGIYQFYQHLHELRKQTNPNSRIILIAHNGKKFDVPVLLNALEKINVTREHLTKLNIFFADSLLIIEKIEKENPLVFMNIEETDSPRKKPKVSKALSSLYKRFFGENYSAHDAIEDVKAMRQVLFESPLGVTKETIYNNTFSAFEV